jgi:signal transduction histidine kinase
MKAEDYIIKINNVSQPVDILDKQNFAGRIPAKYPPDSRLSMNDKTLLAIALEDLRIALDEVRVVQEQLSDQNNNLVAAQQKLDSECMYYKSLFELAPEGYIVTDPQVIIKEANQTAASLLNVSQQFLMGKSLATFIADFGQDTFRSKLFHLHQQARKQDFIVQLQPQNNIAFDAALAVTVVCDTEGKLSHLRWMLHDTRLHKPTTDLLDKIQHQNIQLAEAAQMKSNFLGVISHELRTPLNAILGFCHILLRQTKDELISQRIYFLELIFDNSKNLLTLINDILDFAKLEADSLEFNLEKLNFADLVGEIVEEMHSLAEKKQLNLQVNISLSNWLIVNDKTRLQQVIVNLLNNAIKFTKTGSVLLEIQEVLPDKIAIVVQDTGIGISKKDLKSIFESFWQVNQTLSRSYKGTGLGLAITQALVELMGGKIQVDSKLGEGSTFLVELPRKVQIVD